MTSPTEARRRGGRDDDGFTLLEVLIVLVILGLAAGLVVLRGPSRSAALDTRAAARQVAEALRGARARAIATDRPVLFVLDPTRRRFRVGDGPEEALPAGLRAALVPSPRFARQRMAAISFAPDGSSSGGTVELAGGRQRAAVGVDWLTGQVRLEAARQ